MSCFNQNPNSLDKKYMKFMKEATVDKNMLEQIAVMSCYGFDQNKGVVETKPTYVEETKHMPEDDTSTQ